MLRPAVKDLKGEAHGCMIIGGELRFQGDDALYDSSEVLIGEVPLVASLTIGYERMILFVTSRRLLFGHVGKRGTGAMMGTNLLGRLASGLEAVLKTGPEHRRAKRAEQKTPAKILAAHRDNFAIEFSDVVNISLDEYPPLTRITVLTNREKLEFSTLSNIDYMEDLLSRRLAGRLEAHKSPHRNDQSLGGLHGQ